MVAVAALAGGWWLLANRPDAAIDDFLNARKSQSAAARLHAPAADAFRAIICPEQACAVVEAGGLTFIWGAGAGAAAGVEALGLLYPSLDGILLADTDLRSVEGLAALAQASGRVGRIEPLKIFAPGGSLSVVDGANLLASSAVAPRLILSPDGIDQGLAGKLLFDSGVVEIRAFGSVGRVYRIDFDGKSLVLAGCQATEEDILAATRGVQVAAGILSASSKQLLGGVTGRCTDVVELLEAARQSRLPATLIMPVEPAATIQGAIPAWMEVLPKTQSNGPMVATSGARIELAGPAPKALAGQ